MRLAAPLLQDYVYIANRMREDEREHFVAMTGAGGYDPDTAARVMATTPGPCFALIDAAGYPVVVGGFEPQRPGVYSGWQAGTEDGWALHWKAITLHTNHVFRALFRDGAHRIQLTTLAKRETALEWYERGLKMNFEGVHKGYAADGQDAVTYARGR